MSINQAVVAMQGTRSIAVFVRLAAFTLLLLPVAACEAGETLNGFRLDDTLVPAGQIVSGGPPRDGIPSIDAPRFTHARDAAAPRADDRVLGISWNGISKAYPVAILNYHEIVNDRFGSAAIVVTYCPLCGTGIAYHAKVAGKTLEFGVSGLLYNSDVLLYDRQTESLWSQIRRQAVSGPMQGTKLQPVVLTHTRWEDWKSRHPDTQVLTRDTGHRRNYSINPYAGYALDRSIWFPVQASDARYHPKEQVLGLELAGHFKAYPFSELAKSDGPVNDIIGKRRVVIRYDAANASAEAFEDSGQPLASVILFWFAWYAFHPDSAVYTAR